MCAVWSHAAYRAPTHIHRQAHTHREFYGFVLVFFLAYYTRLLQMHIVNPFGHKGKHTHTYMQPQAHIDTHRWHSSSSRNMSESGSVNIRSVVLALALPQAEMNSLRFPSPCAYVAAKQKFKLHFYFLDTL